MKDLTNRHRHQTIIVAGTSPFVPDLPQSFLDEHITIGVNNYPLIGDCNYLVIADTHKIQTHMPNALSNVRRGTKTFFGRDTKQDDSPEPDYWFTRPRGFLGANNWPRKDCPIPTEWKEPIKGVGLLAHVATVATAAANLAVILGASNIILYRVDLIGNTMFGSREKPWVDFEPVVSHFFNRLPIPVYKTNPNSPLHLPMWTHNEQKTFRSFVSRT